MLYTRQELTQKGFIDSRVAVQRYLHKYLNHRKEISKLKWHEKDFFFEHLQILKNDKGELGFDICSIPEAKEYLLYKLILIYASDNNTIDFNKKAFDYYGEIKKNKKKQHQQIFARLLADWTNELKDGKGQYLLVIKPLYEKKLKELCRLKTEKVIDSRTFTLRDIYMRATFYHVYYLVRKYFDEMKVKADSCVICGINFYADIYSYAHILTRHYYPKMNLGIGGSLNGDIPVLDVRNMPFSVLELVKRYAEKNTITMSTEYLLFIVDGEKYILWLKYGKIALLSNLTGMEIRSFYHCEEHQDLEKFKGKTVIEIDKHLSIVI